MKKLSSKGVVVDFGAMMATSGATVAIGNAKMNARGDILTHGGLVEKTVEEVADAYYKSNPRAVSQAVPLSSLDDEVIASPADAIAAAMSASPDVANFMNNAPVGKDRKRRTTNED